MNPSSATIPFVDLSIQHQPLKTEFDRAMLAVLRQGDFIMGQAVKDFESAFAESSGVKHGIGVACGTDAIALGLKACGIQPGDEIILPANTFIATLIGVIHSGATPILANCDPQSALIDLEAAEKLVTAKTKAILPVHLYGQMVSPQALLDFAQTHNLFIFEDAAQAHLAHREGYTAGSVGKAAAYSFYPSKNLGAFGDGGMVLTNDPEVAQTMQSLRNYGAPRKYYHTELGTNSRLDTIQAAILNVKLPHLKSWNQQRNQAAQAYDRLLAPLAQSGIVPIANFSGSGHVYHLYVIRLLEKSGINRDTLQEKLQLANIQTGIHYPIPCHLQPAYTHLGYHAGDFREAEQLCESILSLPMFPGITSEQMQRVVEAIAECINS
ncbi:DegT/DnrJ/EryC1/StrS aminotransferase family protein [Roseofilum sp. BLCC_M91]|uniref:DegT/DnrJ/EryC1/StrS aminotransferase family protein n=1 Tax=Roseofilum halophilum BLCC-M91 TaxID=3022259 RepID=A0ABT7BEK1_9CYAN|nr:DegT/DnrJ/EryC1/StrS aminotransferase family protein [Roseofilum halophilum]MDJ1177596.1 DegT/DnrJ/EryC1/StrS aminotransferase family protein [Roseofilum halophilum BLCC-M91]